MEPLDRSTIWPYREGEPGELYYQRYAHPNGLAAERALAELEGGEALLFPSGTGAATSLVLAMLEPGQTIALAEGGYYGIEVLLSALERWGVRHVEFDQTGPAARRRRPRLARGSLQPVPDDAGLRGGGSASRRASWWTPPRPRRSTLRPLERGADFVLHSATKYLGGHARRAAGRSRLPLGRRCRAAARVPRPRGDRRRAGPLLAALSEPEDAARANGAAHRRAQRRSPSGLRAHPAVRARALPAASAACSPSTSPTARPRTRSRRRSNGSRTPRASAASTRCSRAATAGRATASRRAYCA